MPAKRLPQRAVADEDPDYSPMDARPGDKAEIEMIRSKIQQTAVEAHSTDRSSPAAVMGKRHRTEG